MGFYYEKRFGASEALRVESIFRQLSTRPEGSQNLRSVLRAQGLGYRNTNMAEDYRHFQAVDKALNPETRQRAEKWYENVYKPLFEKYKSTSKTAEALTRIRKGTIDTSEQAAEAAEYIDNYNAEF